jgi:polar amino acid transport system ATP-binding protein
MTEPIIRFDGVCKSFGALEVLKDLSLSVQPQERIALIGPSGSGKTTILRILMTLENIQGGTVQVEGSQPVNPIFGRCVAQLEWSFSSSIFFRT